MSLRIPTIRYMSPSDTREEEMYRTPKDSNWLYRLLLLIGLVYNFGVWVIIWVLIIEPVYDMVFR